MFHISEIDGKEIHDAILKCQQNEDPIVKVIDAKGLFITPLPPKINLSNTKREFSLKTLFIKLKSLLKWRNK